MLIFPHFIKSTFLDLLWMKHEENAPTFPEPYITYGEGNIGAFCEVVRQQ